MNSLTWERTCQIFNKIWTIKHSTFKFEIYVKIVNFNSDKVKNLKI